MLSFLLLLICTGLPPAAAAATWRIDPGPSSVHFRVQHLVFSHVEGSFRQLSGKVVTANDDFSDARITVTIAADSIDTRHQDRDRGLRGKDFFWASKFPEIRFESTSVTRTSGRTYAIVGNLTIRGVTRSIELTADFRGQKTISMGRQRADFHAVGSLDRFDYGLEWNEVVEAGRALVGATVEIVLDIALIRDDTHREAD